MGSCLCFDLNASCNARYVLRIFKLLQQLPSRGILKAWIKVIEPKSLRHFRTAGNLHRRGGLAMLNIVSLIIFTELVSGYLRPRTPCDLPIAARYILAIAILRYVMHGKYQNQGLKRLKQSRQNVKLQSDKDSDEKGAQRERLFRQLYEVAGREEAYRNDGQSTSDALPDFCVTLLRPNASFAINLVRPQAARETSRRCSGEYRSKCGRSRSYRANEGDLVDSSLNGSILEPPPGSTRKDPPMCLRSANRQDEERYDHVRRPNGTVADSSPTKALLRARPSQASFRGQSPSPFPRTPPQSPPRTMRLICLLKRLRFVIRLLPISRTLRCSRRPTRVQRELRGAS